MVNTSLFLVEEDRVKGLRVIAWFAGRHLELELGLQEVLDAVDRRLGYNEETDTFDVDRFRCYTPWAGCYPFETWVGESWEVQNFQDLLDRHQDFCCWFKRTSRKLAGGTDKFHIAIMRMMHRGTLVLTTQLSQARGGKVIHGCDAAQLDRNAGLESVSTEETLRELRDGAAHWARLLFEHENEVQSASADAAS